MPNKDGMGPNGQGSRTGRGLGNCVKELIDGKKDTNESDQLNTTPNFGRNSNMRKGLGRSGRNQGSGRGNRNPR
ncbi:MAG: DUF5320 domain-containing protein [Candidatus Absconditabacteria bacterium]